VAYWRDGFDSQARERELNAVQQFTADIDGQRVHFVQVRARESAPGRASVPLILTHGGAAGVVRTGQDRQPRALRLIAAAFVALANPVLLTEARVTVIDGLLAVAVLLGLVLNAAVGWWWADPAAGLVIVYYAAREVRIISSEILRRLPAQRHGGAADRAAVDAGTGMDAQDRPTTRRRPPPHAATARQAHCDLQRKRTRCIQPGLALR
jgi:hypothetical protein